MMVAVAIIGASLGYAHRLRKLSARYRAMEAAHMVRMDRVRRHCIMGQAIEYRQLLKRIADHESKLCDKYERAARYPWLPVAPDPPEPRDGP
jgi:hypothetical protein